MKTKAFMTMAAATLLLVACNNENTVNGPTPLRISSGVEVQTRALIAEGVQDKQIVSSQVANIWVDEAITVPEALYQNNLLTADGAGNFTPATDMFFPQSGNGVHIYGIHGKFSTDFAIAESFPTAGKEYEVLADQSTAANVAQSDLLFAIKKHVARTTEAVPLTFYHMLSKVMVAIKIGAGSPILATIGAVKLNGVTLNGSFVPNLAADMTNQSERAAMIASAGVPSVGNITLDQVTTIDFNQPSSVYNDVILAPQDLTGKTLTFKLADGGVLTYTFPATTLESGKKYIYNITLNLSGLTVTSTVADWSAVTPVTGDATMNNPV